VIVISEIEKLCASSYFLEKPILFEGVHLTTEVLPILSSYYYTVFVLRMPDRDEHMQRIRNSAFKTDSHVSKQLQYLDNIRIIGNYLEKGWAVAAERDKNIYFIDNIDEILEIIKKLTNGSLLKPCKTLK
jgi:2-phosphoglycerate kinase